MARIAEYKEIPLDDLEIGRAQVRTQHVGEGLDELAQSIKTIGLLHPIVVCPAERPGKYEILLGQRRYLAHRMLQLKTIRCAVFDERVDPITAKVISLSENMVRRGLDRRDLIDVCTALHKHYGSIKLVVEATGLPEREVRQYVKYDRLIPELKKMVDEEKIDVNVALRAQDASSVSTGEPDPHRAVVYARELSRMSGENQKQLLKVAQQNPDRPAEEIVEKAKTGARVVQVIVTLGEAIHRRLKQYAADEEMNLDEAAGTLIREALTAKGYLEDEDV